MMKGRRMRFDLANVKNCLRDNRRVFSVRSYCLDNCVVEVEGIGLCKRIRGFEVKCKEDLIKYVGLSGFDSIEEWWYKVELFCKGKRKWIYKVKVVEAK